MPRASVAPTSEARQGKDKQNPDRSARHIVRRSNQGCPRYFPPTPARISLSKTGSRRRLTKLLMVVRSTAPVLEPKAMGRHQKIHRGNADEESLPLTTILLLRTYSLPYAHWQFPGNLMLVLNYEHEIHGQCRRSERPTW